MITSRYEWKSQTFFDGVIYQQPVKRKVPQIWGGAICLPGDEFLFKNTAALIISYNGKMAHEKELKSNIVQASLLLHFAGFLR